ncbi:MAG: D-aminoacyl-tRNA deacylase, partial [Kiritimatiellia bacterium]
RLFEDEAGKMNLALAEVGGGLLVVSQFTLLGDCRKGRRPGFDQAARPEVAIPLYERFVAGCRATGLFVATGRFQRPAHAPLQMSRLNAQRQRVHFADGQPPHKPHLQPQP